MRLKEMYEAQEQAKQREQTDKPTPNNPDHTDESNNGQPEKPEPGNQTEKQEPDDQPEKPEPKPEEQKSEPDDEDEEYDDDGKLSKGKIIAIAIVLLIAGLITAYNVGWFGTGPTNSTADVSGNNPAAEETEEAVTVTASTLAEAVSKARARGAEPVLMPDNEHYIYVEGISPEKAAEIDFLLHYATEVSDTDPAEAEGVEDVYATTLPRVAQSWDPNFDLIEAVLASDTQATYKKVPIKEILSIEENRQYFYFEWDETGEVYQASNLYYYLTGVWADIVAEKAEEAGEE